MNQPNPGDTYRHYKGNEYEIVCIGKHTETEEDMVVCRALYADGGTWIRPLAMFTETIEKDGIVIPRFEKIN